MAQVTEAQQQWWEIKAANFDSVLLFKMGKFYEMFEMDAYVGVDILGLQFMGGEQPHAGECVRERPAAPCRLCGGGTGRLRHGLRAALATLRTRSV